MKNNQPNPDTQTWTPADRTLWLAKHGAPANMRLITDLEITVVNNGLKSEQQAKANAQLRADILEGHLALIQTAVAEYRRTATWCEHYPVEEYRKAEADLISALRAAPEHPLARQVHTLRVATLTLLSAAKAYQKASGSDHEQSLDAAMELAEAALLVTGPKA